MNRLLNITRSQPDQLKFEKIFEEIIRAEFY